MPISGRQWAVALSAAMLMHAAIAGAVLWESPKAGAESAGIGGISVSLGPAGGAPGGEVMPVDAVVATGTIEPTELAQAEAAIETRTIDSSEAVPLETVPPVEVRPARPHEAPTETVAASVLAETGMRLPAEPVEIPTVAVLETLAETTPTEEASAAPVPRVTKIVTEPEVQVATVRPPVQQAMVNPIDEPDLRAQAVPPPPKAKPRPPEPTRAHSKPPATAKVDRESNRRAAQATNASEAPKSTEVRENAVTPSLAGAGGKSGALASLNAGSGDNTPGGGAAAAMADYYGRLQAWLEKYKRYPRRAKLRNEEGVALLRFVVTRAGEVSDFSIEKSSGHPLLDEEVGEMLRRAQPFPKMPSDMYESRVELLVPVQFFLR